MSPVSGRWQWPSSSVDLLPATFAFADANAHRLALDLFLQDPDARRRIGARTDDHDVSDRDRSRLVDDPAGDDLGAAHPGRVLDRTRSRVALGDVQVLDDDPALGGTRLDDAASLAAVLAGEHLYEIALPHLHLDSHSQHLWSQAHDLHEVLLA